jgi:putative ABC transport system substrate-binding protein
MIEMKRRELLAAIGGAVAWPVVARGQPSAIPEVGFLGSRASGDDPQLLIAFRKGLRETGFTEGLNLAIEYRWAGGQYDRLPELAADLARRRVLVIVANGPAALAAKAATVTIPIVFTVGFDPVEVGLVSNLNRPGGNITGSSILDVELGPKRLEILHALVPKTSALAALVNPADALRAKLISESLQAAAHTLGRQLHVLNASTERELETVFITLVKLGAGGLVIGGDPFFNSRGEQLGALSSHHAIPTIYQFRAFAMAGGLVSYGANLAESYHTSGVYTGRILKGEKPGDLPVQRAATVEMIINLKTAKALGISIPLDLSGRADELIE